MKNEKVKEREKQMGVQEAKELSWRNKLYKLATFSPVSIFAVTLLQREREGVLGFAEN